MSGAPDLLYVRARAALLDVAEALDEQLDAVVLVGAQAVYIHTGDANFVATAPYTTDADFCIAPAHLNNTPLLDELLTARGFSPGEQPGSWRSPAGFPSISWFPKRWPDPVPEEPALDPTARESQGAPKAWRQHSSIGSAWRSCRSNATTTDQW